MPARTLGQLLFDGEQGIEARRRVLEHEPDPCAVQGPQRRRRGTDDLGGTDARGSLDVGAWCVEEPGRGQLAEVWPQLAADWRAKQLEYSWVRTLMGAYQDFWALTEQALDRAHAFFQTNKSIPGALAAAGLRGSDFIQGWKRREDALDIGLIDDNGRIRITDRKKDLLVTAGDKNVAPGPIESELAADPLIVMALGAGEMRLERRENTVHVATPVYTSAGRLAGAVYIVSPLDELRVAAAETARLHFFLSIFALALVLPLWAAAAIAVVAFTLGHLYQGPKGLVRVFVLSVLFAGLYLLGLSLWPLMIIHAAVDPQVRNITGLPPAVALGQQATTSGTSSSRRQAEELSMTMGPALPIFSDHSLDTAPPADISTRSTFEKSNCSMSWHLMVLSPKETSTPLDLRDAMACSSSTGKLTSSRMFSISRPTLPVAPATTTR